MKVLAAGRQCVQPCDARLESALPINCGDTGRGKPSPPTVPYVRHYGSVEVPERVVPAYRAVQEGGGAEATAFCGGGGKGSNIKGFQRIWAPP